MVSVLECTENMEDTTQLIVQLSILPTIMKPSLVPRVPQDQGFLQLMRLSSLQSSFLLILITQGSAFLLMTSCARIPFINVYALLIDRNHYY